MAENTKIEWADHTFNPWVGCQVASPDGCKNCYAADWAKRYGRDFAQRTRTSETNWKQPLKWNAQAEREGRRFRVFCASLADVFDNQAPTAWRMDLFSLIADTPHLDWLLLTKRIGNVMPMCSGDSLMFDMICSRVWLGATVVNQAEADRDVPKLLAVPAAKRFLSVEPMLGPIDLSRIEVHGGDAEIYPLKGTTDCVNDEGEPADDVPAIDWVICGGESGPQARPMHPDWARSLRDQCHAAGVPFLFKQWGEWIPYEDSAQPPFKFSQHGHEIDGHWLPDFESEDGLRQREWICDWGGMLLARRVGKKAAGRLLDGVEHNGVPAIVATASTLAFGSTT